NSRYAYGTFHINFTGLDTPENDLCANIDTATNGFARKDLARAVAKDGRRLMQWLKNEGIELVDLGGYGTNVLSPPWRKGFGLTWENYGGDDARTIGAPAVVIADGGFTSNLDMLRQYAVSPAPEKLLARNGGAAVGDGMRMAQALGAQISEAGMNNFSGHLHNRDAMHSPTHWPRPVTDDLAA